MLIHSTIALAYAAQDQLFAERIEQDLKPVAKFRHFRADQQNDGQSLAQQLQDFSGPVLLLVSDNFLRSPNSMHNANRLLSSRGGRNDTQVVLLDIERYDAQIEETVIVPAKVARQADIMNYINHWQERYLDLRRQKSALSKEIGPSFDEYLGKIREISGQVNDFLHYLKDSMPLRLVEFTTDNYRQFFIFLEEEQAWRNFEVVDTSNSEFKDSLTNKVARTNAEAEEAPAPQPVVPPPPPPKPEPKTELPEPPEVIDTEENIEADEDGLATSSEQSETKTAPSEAIEGLIQRAWNMADEGEWQTALDLLKSGSDAYPSQPDLIYHQALLLSTEADDIATAEQLLDELLEEYPDHQDALFLRGELHFAEGDYDQARSLWEALADQNTDYPDLAQELGLLLANHFPQDQILALGQLEKATQAGSEEAQVYFHHGRLVAQELDKREKAEVSWQKALELDPELADAIAELRPAAVQTQNLASPPSPPPPSPPLPTPQPSTPKTETPTVMPLSSASADALTALKENIAQLEAMLQERESAVEAAQAEAEKAKLEARIGHGKTVLISGATSGIGKATAYALAADGYRLIITGRRGDRLESIAAELREHDVEVLTLTFDVRDNAAVESAIGDLGKKWSSIDILINNAGKAKGLAPIHKGDLDHWNEMIDVNLKGLLYLTRAVTPKMTRRKKGLILNVCSTAGKEVYANGNVYCATKHAVDALTRAMRLDLVKYGIKVGQICPAHVEETEFSEVRFDGDKKKAAKVYEDFQPLTSSDVAETIAFMLSRPDHVNILDVVLQGKQQASSSHIERSGR